MIAIAAVPISAIVIAMGAVAILLYSVSLTNLALAGLVFWRRPKVEINRVFGLTALAVAAWTLTNAVFQTTDSVPAAIEWANVSYVSALIVGAALFHFSLIYPERTRSTDRHHRSLLNLGLWLTTGIFSLLPFIPHWVIQNVELAPDRRILTNAGLYPLAIFVFATVVGALVAFVVSLRATHGRQQMQALYVLTGMGITAAFGLSCNLVLPLVGNYSLVWLGPASSLTFVGCTVYSIVKERLFDVRIIIHRSLVYGLLVAVISGAYSAIEFGLTDVLQQSSLGDQHPLFSHIGGAVAVSLCVSPVRKWLERQVDRIIFRRGHGHRHS